MGRMVLGLVVLGVVTVVVVIVRHNLRLRRARADAAAIPPAERNRLMGLMAPPPGEAPLVVLLVPDPSAPPDGRPGLTRVGGSPDAGLDAPPEADFLLQVRLAHPGLPPAWQDRLVGVWLDDDFQPQVRSCRPSSAAAPASPSDAEPAVRPLRLLEVPVRSWETPSADPEDGAPDPTAPVTLVAAFPDLDRELHAWGDDPAGILGALLTGGAGGHETDAADLGFVGGSPVLIQNPHDEAVCPTCGAAMTFLFQTGDLFGDCRLGDAGVLYVYGCAAHPDQARGFVDCH